VSTATASIAAVHGKALDFSKNGGDGADRAFEVM